MCLRVFFISGEKRKNVNWNLILKREKGGKKQNRVKSVSDCVYFDIGSEKKQTKHQQQVKQTASVIVLYHRWNKPK